MNKNIRIIYIIDNMLMGGAQVHLIRLANRLSTYCNVKVFSLGPVSDKLRKCLSPKVVLTVFAMDSIRSALFFPSFLLMALQIKKDDPEIVHTYLNTANVFGLFAARIAGVRTVITSRRDMGLFRSHCVGVIEALIGRFIASGVFCVCKAVAEVAIKQERIPESKVSVLLNGIDVENYTPRIAYNRTGPVVFAIISSLNRQVKGHSVLMLAAAEAFKMRPEMFTLQVIGEGSLRSECERMCKNLGITGCVDFKGEIDDISAALEHIDVLVVPSFSEGISNAVLESMAMGVPVIATAVDGNIEVIESGSEGVLVEAGKPELLAEAMINYMDQPDLIERHGRRAREKAETFFSERGMVENYLNAYARVYDVESRFKSR